MKIRKPEVKKSWSIRRKEIVAYDGNFCSYHQARLKVPVAVANMPEIEFMSKKRVLSKVKQDYQIESPYHSSINETYPGWGRRAMHLVGNNEFNGFI